MMETNSPSRISRDTPSTTLIGPVAVGKSTETLSKRILTFGSEDGLGEAVSTLRSGVLMLMVSDIPDRSQAMRSCHATRRRVAARRARSINIAIRPMQMIPT